ncbi:MAG: hypothetical protein ACI9DC_001135 [Gammaproteobacteria bacterium]|jgi:hypothetical protein
MPARADFVSAILMAGIAIVFLLTSNTIGFDPDEPGIGPRAFPVTVSILICLLSALMMIRAFKPVRDSGWDLLNREERRLFFVWVLPMVALAFAYVLLIDLFQYLLPTILVSAATLALFGNRGKTWLIVTPVLAGLFYYIVFFGVFRPLETRGRILEFENNQIFGPLRNLLGT